MAWGDEWVNPDRSAALLLSPKKAAEPRALIAPPDRSKRNPKKINKKIIDNKILNC
jgi:hypothetical protein